MIHITSGHIEIVIEIPAFNKKYSFREWIFSPTHSFNRVGLIEVVNITSSASSFSRVSISKINQSISLIERSWQAIVYIYIYTDMSIVFGLC